MKTIAQIQTELRDKRQANADLKALLDTEKRNMTDEELSAVETRTTEIAALEVEMRKAIASQNLIPAGGAGSSEEKELRKFDIQKVMRSATSKNVHLDGFELEMQKEAEAEMRASGASFNPNAVYVPMAVLRAVFANKVENRDITTTTSGSSYGGYNIGTTLNGYVAALREQSRIMQLGTKWTTGVVGNLDYSQESTVFEPTFLAEQGSSSEVTPTYTKITASPKRMAGYMDISNQWLAQTAPEFQMRLWEQIITGMAIAADKVGFVGGGSNEPTGIIADTNVPVIYAGGATSNATNADGAAPVYQDALNAWKKVGNNAGLTDNSRFALSYDLFAKLLNVKVDSGSGQMVLDRVARTILGLPASASMHVPNSLTKGSGTGLSAMVLGDFTTTEFFQWGGIEILQDPYTQAVTGTTRVHAAGYIDFLRYKPKAFVIGKDFITT